MSRLSNETLSLFVIWVCWVVLFSTLIYIFINGEVVFGRKVEFSHTRIFLILFFAICDLIFRYLVFGNIQSTSLDIILFSLVYRITIVFLDAGVSPEEKTVVPIIMFVIFAMGVGLYWYFQKAYRDNFKGWLQPALSNAPNKNMIEEICIKYKHTDLWGVFRREEINHIRELIKRYPNTNVSQLGKDFELELWRRAFVVSGLAILTILCIFLNALTIEKI